MSPDVPRSVQGPKFIHIPTANAGEMVGSPHGPVMLCPCLTPVPKVWGVLAPCSCLSRAWYKAGEAVSAPGLALSSVEGLFALGMGRRLNPRPGRAAH